MDCICTNKSDNALKVKLHAVHHELVDGARRILRTATDPISAIVHFLNERPEDSSLTGRVMDFVLRETFEDETSIPSLIKILAGHVREINRRANVIDILNEHAVVEKWGSYLIKQKERIKFEITRERNLFVLNNINGLYAVEHGMELPVETIRVEPPVLIVTVKLGVLRPQRIVSISA